MKTFSKKLMASIFAMLAVLCAFFGVVLLSSPQTAKADTLPTDPPKTIDDVVLPDGFEESSITELKEGDVVAEKYILVLNPSCSFGFNVGSVYVSFSVADGFFVQMPSGQDSEYFEPEATDSWWIVTYIPTTDWVVDVDGETIDYGIKKDDTFSNLHFLIEGEQAPEGFAMYLLSKSSTEEPDSPAEEYEFYSVNKEMPDVSGFVEVEVEDTTNIMGRVVRVYKTYTGNCDFFSSKELIGERALLVSFYPGSITVQDKYIITIPSYRGINDEGVEYYDVYIPTSSDVVIGENNEEVENPITLESFTVETSYDATMKVYLLCDEDEIPPESDTPENGQEPEENKPSVDVSNENTNSVLKVLLSVVLISFLGFGCFYIVGKFKSKNKRRK